MIVALDVDGTLFDGHAVDPAAVDAVHRAAADGHTILIVTGRVWRDLPQIIPELLPDVAAAVCEHGTVMVIPATGSVAQLAPPVAAAIVEAVTATGWRPVVVGHATIGLPAGALEVAEAVCREYPGYHVEDNKASIAIVPIGFDKGTGLAGALDQLGLAGGRVLAVGDALNDLPMFAAADIAVIVANAEPALLTRGIEVTTGEFGAGVAEALARHLP